MALAPAVAQACPYCAGQTRGGTAQLVLLGAFVFFPFAVVAAIVGLFYMHLKHETRILKLTVAIPMATPMVYALVLIAEAAWRLR